MILENLQENRSAKEIMVIALVMAGFLLAIADFVTTNTPVNLIPILLWMLLTGLIVFLSMMAGNNCPGLAIGFLLGLSFSSGDAVWRIMAHGDSMSWGQTETAGVIMSALAIFGQAIYSPPGEKCRDTVFCLTVVAWVLSLPILVNTLEYRLPHSLAFWGFFNIASFVELKNSPRTIEHRAFPFAVCFTSSILTIHGLYAMLR